MNSSSTGFEWRTRFSFLGIPLIHVAFGRDALGKRRVAKGFLAIGQIAVGLVAFGQFAIGIFFGVGQVAVGLLAAGQVAGGLLFGFGQLAIGMVAIGQVVAGVYGLGQVGWAKYLWSTHRQDIEAIAMLSTLKSLILQEQLTFGQIASGVYGAFKSWISSLLE